MQGCWLYDVWPLLGKEWHVPFELGTKARTKNMLFLGSCWGHVVLSEGSLEVKLPTICRDGKAEVGRVREEKSRSEKIRDGESQKRQDAGAQKGREVAIHCVCPLTCGSGGSKNNLAKAAGAEPAGQMRDEKVRPPVARSTFPSQNVQSTRFSAHFWQLRCRKSGRRCGA